MRLAMPFTGVMICSRCGVQSRGPAFCGGWRAIDAESRLRYYACPRCRPADDAPTTVWQQWYVAVVGELFEMNNRRSINKLKIWRELGDGRVSSHDLGVEMELEPRTPQAAGQETVVASDNRSYVIKPSFSPKDRHDGQIPAAMLMFAEGDFDHAMRCYNTAKNWMDSIMPLPNGMYAELSICEGNCSVDFFTGSEAGVLWLKTLQAPEGAQLLLLDPLADSLTLPGPAEAFCERHFAPFQPGFPRSYEYLGLEVIKAVLSDARFCAELNCTPEMELRELDFAKANEFIECHSPLCCFLGDDVMRQITGATLATMVGDTLISAGAREAE